MSYFYSTMNIKQTVYTAVVGFALAVPGVMLAAPNAYAGDVCGTKTTIIEVDCVKDSDKLEDNAIWGILLMVITIMTAGVGLLAVGGLVYGAILYATAREQAGQITKAKETIANVVLGLVLYAFMWSLLQFLIPGGVFK